MTDLEKIFTLMNELIPEESEKKNQLKEMVQKFDMEIDLLHMVFVQNEWRQEVLNEFYRCRDNIYGDSEEDETDI